MKALAFALQSVSRLFYAVQAHKRAYLFACVTLLITLLLGFQVLARNSTIHSTPDTQEPDSAPVRAAPLTLDEGFEDVPGLTDLSGPRWHVQNNSDPLGSTGWFQGDTARFDAQAGSNNSYIAADFRNVQSNGTISNWLISPALAFTTGNTISFWTRSGGIFPDRLEVRMSKHIGLPDVGTTSDSVGDFTELILELNPTLTANGYPTVWTEIPLTVPASMVGESGRIAFRYYVTEAGSGGSNGDYIGIDSFSTDAELLPSNNVFLPLLLTPLPPAKWQITNTTGGTLLVELEGVGSRTFGAGTETWDDLDVQSGTYNFKLTVNGGLCDGDMIEDTVNLVRDRTTVSSFQCILELASRQTRLDVTHEE